ncbi:MAG: Sapep family Mn(2+)-dependent dipeptidase, partial [Solobacterium sp.]|nr:Sapep family Mn(2+)-dependent dipeptidase [Solobacterium sp.]
MKFIDEARAYQDNMIEDLRELVKIESVRDDAAATKEAPFGPNIAKCLDKALEIGKRDGFKVENVDGYAGVIQYGDLEESVGVLGHLDVVPIGDGWTFDPLGGEIKDGYIMGRGTCDDKGPAIAAYYAMKILKDKGYKLKHNIQMILGTDEENTSAGILYYKKVRKNPIMGIVPDADFPCIYAEKGILDFAAQGKIDSCIKYMKAGTAFNVVISKADVIVDKPLSKEYFEKFLLANE